ncbi:MAG: zf-HC2 domain-containing protein [Thermomicrobiales bacterium]
MTMRCADEGRLRAYLDAELAAGERDELAAHLDACPDCAGQLATLREETAAVSTLLAAWLPEPVADPAATSDERQARAALARFRSTMRETAGDNGVAPQGFIGRTKEWAETMIARLNTRRLRPALGAVALVAILGLVFTLSPVASLADQLTKTFRVQQFQAVTVHVPQMSSLPQMTGGNMGDISPEQLAQLQALLAPLGTPTTNVTATTAREVADQAAARDFLAGHGSKLYAPKSLPAAYSGLTARYGVADPTSSTYKLNVATAKQYIGFANSPELSALPWPEGVDTLSFGLDTPAAVATIYGDQATHQGFGIVQMAVLNSDIPGAGPVLTLPDELDVNAFRTAILALPGLPADTVAQVKGIKDWERTLIIPVPEDATSKNVTVKGNAGLLILDGQGRGGIVIWQQNGMLFAVGGTLGESDIMAIANGLVQVP